tara:strand:+ start:555 stop:938 length:384 start_codon:yes stop_codon:yes gene_type:complete
MSYKTYEVCVYDNGDEFWYLNAKLHREDGPAVIYANGSKFWYLNGKLHREDEPAVIHANGDKCWYLNGKCHRENGPAILFQNGYKTWCLNGKFITEAEHKQQMQAKQDDCSNKVVEVDGKKYKLQAI